MIKQYLVHYKYKSSGDILYTTGILFINTHNFANWWQQLIEDPTYKDFILVDVSYLGEVNE